ncbi:hypothetical protein BDP27DRAFT_1338086 [Rhodocollybia butyracea]|uniref:Aprataxin and PNK-like factor PBZ domain-containing protein n=1 Tax=Rhodocollybia butyracea TaxID=206335 RepID=A0A9P5PG10_9AGAR|nr:hypothetical protein BDP27DRAFT_1338086 [Rhodocollybia butyracea]
MHPDTHSDVLLRVMCSLPTFHSLYSTIQCSKAFYDTYRKHAKQIITAVATNCIGPAFSLALQVACHDNPPLTKVSMTKHSDPEVDTDFNLALKQARALADNAKIVTEWEDLFSVRQKDARFRTSQLSPTESWRFQKAVYRLMLYSRLFPIDNDAYNVITNFGVNDPSLDDERNARRDFLSECFSNELNQLQLVGDFMVEIVRWVDCVDGSDMKGVRDFVDIALSAGPAIILECFRTLGFEPLTEAINQLCPKTTPEYFEDIRRRPFLSGYLSDSITKVLYSRHPEGGSGIRVLSSQHLQHPCSQCGVPAFSPALWRVTTWDYLSLASSTLGSYLFPEASKHLKGSLGQNSVELERVTELLLETPFKEIYEDIFTKGLKLPAYKDRDDDYAVCYSCLSNFIKDHLHMWVIMKRKEANEQVANDCWYGYNCRTQVHKLSHAQQLNHLCEPRR